MSKSAKKAAPKAAPKQAAPAPKSATIRTANTPDEMRSAIAGKTLVQVLDSAQTLSAAKKALVIDALYARLATRAIRTALFHAANA